MLKQEKPVISGRNQAEIDNSAERGLAKVVSVLRFVFRQPNFRQNHIEARQKADRIKDLGPAAVELRQLHSDLGTRWSQF